MLPSRRLRTTPAIACWRADLVCRLKGHPMRIRTNLFVTLDGKVSGPDCRPVQLLLSGFRGADSYGLPEFLANCEAVCNGPHNVPPGTRCTAVAVEATGLRPDLQRAA